MELNQLKCFLEVARLEHITQAADQLHITQPALSKVIARLEDDLGVKLFDREGKNIRLNEYGRVAQNYAQRIMYTIGDMEAELAEMVRRTGGEPADRFLLPGAGAQLDLGVHPDLCPPAA